MKGMSVTRERRVVGIAVAVGIGLGIFSMLADGIIGGRLIGILGNIAAPWGLAAFLVGHRTTSPKRGAALGALTLVVGVGVYHLAAAARGYALPRADVVWTLVALVAGPIMGWSGAEIATRPERPPLAAVAAPSAMLVAEAIFLAYDRKVWRWNLRAEPYRLFDLGVMLALLIVGLAIPAVFETDPGRRGVTYLVVVGAGALGAVGLVVLERVLVAII
jgi:hypothetical protein